MQQDLLMFHSHHTKTTPPEVTRHPCHTPKNIIVCIFDLNNNLTGTGLGGERGEEDIYAVNVSFSSLASFSSCREGGGREGAWEGGKEGGRAGGREGGRKVLIHAFSSGH